MILPPYTTKSLGFKAFQYPFRSKVSRLLRAEQHTRRDEYEENYKKLLQIYSTKEFQLKEDIEGYIRLKYNYAHHLTINGQIIEALEIALDTIDFCKKNNTVYQMPSLLLLVANSCEKFLSKEEILEYYFDAKTLAKLYGNEVLYLKIKKYLSNL
ncbi:transcriptional regulator [Streptococcus suis]|uniref:Transcriptional regulator PlcR n=1 Tax=Streptococcus suis TaxID=1307 RepID=A0A0Z8JV77_STRSU|nr:hypothetical protein [Streptococcus suis]NQN11743.1 transcriptional regulator [Streptococcus suis]CYV60625.1 transcriptional regulator PlcR [Streptococcus suis]